MEEIKLHQFQEKLELLGYSKRCVKDYPATVQQFLTYLKEKEDVVTLEAVTPQHLKGYQTYVQFDKKLTTGGICGRLTALKVFYRIMHREALITDDLSQHIVLPRRHKKVPRYVPTQEQMKSLLQATSGSTTLSIRDRALLEVLYATGIRCEELCTLTLDDWDSSNNTLFITGKGSKERLVPLGVWVIPFMSEYLQKSRPKLVKKQNPFLFVSKHGRQLLRQNVSRLVSRYSRKAGIVHMSTHSIRHACATHLLENGADIRYVQELLGHRDLSATQIYTKVDISLLKKAHAQFHPRERLYE